MGCRQGLHARIGRQRTIGTAHGKEDIDRSDTGTRRMATTGAASSERGSHLSKCSIGTREAIPTIELPLHGRSHSQNDKHADTSIGRRIVVDLAEAVIPVVGIAAASHTFHRNHLLESDCVSVVMLIGRKVVGGAVHKALAAGVRIGRPMVGSTVQSRAGTWNAATRTSGQAVARAAAIGRAAAGHEHCVHFEKQ